MVLALIWKVLPKNTAVGVIASPLLNFLGVSFVFVFRAGSQNFGGSFMQYVIFSSEAKISTTSFNF